MLRRLRYWIANTKHGEALREEMELHLAEKAAELQADGMTVDHARAEARRRFGNVELKHEQSREIWMTRFWSEVVQDVRYASRAMIANKAFTALAVLSLALGIGANTTIYSFMESILLRSLPVENPESLVLLNWQSQPPQDANKQWVHVVHGVQGLFWLGDKRTLVSGVFPYRAFEMLHEDNPVFSTLFGYFNGLNKTLTIRGQTTSAGAEYVTGEYFHGLAVSPAAGRLLSSEDDRPGAVPVAVISFASSQKHFGGPPNAIGQPILVDNFPFTVIGVASSEFFGVDPAATPDLYLPLHTSQLAAGSSSDHRMYHDDNFYWIEMMGRLRPGVSMAQARVVLSPRFHQWVAATASTDGERAKLPALILNPGAQGLGSLRRQYSKPLYLLLAMVGLILAVACANIANLLLARAAARSREMAVRLSLGAGRFRVVRQLLTESVILASLGGAFGFLFAFWGVRSLAFLLSRGQETFTPHAELNAKVLAATAALSVLCGLLFGLVPALQSTRPDVVTALKKGRGGAPSRAQQVLVVGQIATSFLILFVAGLFVRTLDNLHAVQLGYAREHILLFSLNARQVRHHDPEMITFYSDLRRRFESVPGVRSATLSQASIISAGHAGTAYRGTMKIGAATIQGANVMVTGSRFLTTMQIPILAGREIDDRDQASSLPVAVISERLARTYFGNANPLGRRITLVDENRDLEIVGVSANLRYGSLKEGGNSMTVFTPASQFSLDLVTYALRTSGEPLNYVSSVYEIVRQADSRIPVTNVVTQAAEIARTLSQEIAFAKLCSGFAVLALLTACVGLYGTMSYSVSRQVGEIGTRMALGAQRGVVIWMFLRRVLLLTAAALAISVPAAFGAFRVVKSFLFDIQPNDPRTMALAGVVLLTAALLAGYAPARRASRIDPLTALRHE